MSAGLSRAGGARGGDEGDTTGKQNKGVRAMACMTASALWMLSPSRMHPPIHSEREVYS